MAEFTLDTSGHVEHPHGSDDVSAIYWTDLTPFEQGYVEALFASLRERWLTIASERQQDAWNLHYPAFSDVAPETLAAIRKDCAALHYVIIGCVMGGDVARGRVAWEWRQRPEGHPKSPNMALHHRFPPLTVYLGDDGKVRLSPPPRGGSIERESSSSADLGGERFVAPTDKSEDL